MRKNTRLPFLTTSGGGSTSYSGMGYGVSTPSASDMRSAGLSGEVVIRVVTGVLENNEYDAFVESWDAETFSDITAVWALDLADSTSLTADVGTGIDKFPAAFIGTFPGGSYYVFINATPLMGTAFPNSGFWLKIVGTLTPVAWTSGQAFVAGNLTVLGGSIYIAKQNNTNQMPPNTNWEPLPVLFDYGVYNPEILYSKGSCLRESRPIYAFRSSTSSSGSGTVTSVGFAVSGTSWIDVATLGTNPVTTTGTLTELWTGLPGDTLYASGIDSWTALSVGALGTYKRVSPATGLPIWDTLKIYYATSGFSIVLANTGALSADRILSINMHDAARTIDLSGSLTVGGGGATVTGTNSGDQTITLTGAVTGSGTGTFATTLATPGTLTVSSTNSNATAHTHAITSSSAPGASASILATDASGIIGSTGTRIVKIWATDLTVTNTISGSITGNAGTATTLQTTRTISITGDGSWTVSFNGSANVTAAITLATVNSNVGTFTNATITVNAKGLITAASSGTASPVYATNSVLAQTARVDLLAITTPNDATVHQYDVGGYVNFLSSTGSETLEMWLTFNDENNNPQTLILYPVSQAGVSPDMVLASPTYYYFPKISIDAYPNKALKVSIEEIVGGTYSYNAGANILRLN